MPSVAILGGGVAGMSAAHMLIRKGFEVTVYEKQPEYVGGKARSVNVPGTNTSDPNLYLPGEHGFRFFPGFYRHITQTMKQIPMPGGGRAFDSLVPTETVAIYQSGKAPTITIPLNFPTSVDDLLAFFKAFFQTSAELSEGELWFFAMRVWQLMTSCEERYENEYESIGWWEYLEADNFSEAYQALLVEGLTRSLVAAQAELISTRTLGTVLLQLIYDILQPKNKNADRVLNAPTNEAWLDPWLAYLEDKGVNFHKGCSLAGITMEGATVGSAIKHVTIQDDASGKTLPPVSADYYLLATPVEVVAPFISGDLLAADPSLGSIVGLANNTEWMNGIQFYLTEAYPMHKGHSIYVNSNWALTSISQVQFWPDYNMEDRFNGLVKGILSVDISDWSKPGNFNGKAARDCTRLEVIIETWRQLKEEINRLNPRNRLSNDMLVFVYLDEDIYRPFPNDKLTDRLAGLKIKQEDGIPISKLENKEPLLVNLVNSWALRPNAFTGIPNLFLASDYVKTYTDLATMEGANEAARRAVNGILDASKSEEKKEKIWPYKTPKTLKALRRKDKKRWEAGLPWHDPRRKSKKKKSRR